MFKISVNPFQDHVTRVINVYLWIQDWIQIRAIKFSSQTNTQKKKQNFTNKKKKSWALGGTIAVPPTSAPLPHAISWYLHDIRPQARCSDPTCLNSVRKNESSMELL